MRKVITESQLRRIVKESVKRVLKEERANIDFTTSDLWSKYDIPWNDVDNTPEEYNGNWHVSFDVFDYTYHMGTIEIDENFSDLEECLNFAQNLKLGDIEEYIDNNIEKLDEDGDYEYVHEHTSKISLNILCDTENGTYEVANTIRFVPKE